MFVGVISTKAISSMYGESSSSNHDGCISDDTIIDGLQKECMVEGNIGTNAVSDQMLDNHNAKRFDETSINLGGKNRGNELLINEYCNDMDEGEEEDEEVFGNVLTESFVLPEGTYCSHCYAKKFTYESRCFCCCDGAVALAINDAPDELYALFTRICDESKHFLKYIRGYNNNFSFTSFGVKLDDNVSIKNKGIYTFRIQGQVYHYINQLLPCNDQPSYLQLYFFDTEHEVENRIGIFDNLKKIVLLKLINILSINPYTKFFRSLSTISNLSNQEICIRSDPSFDQRVYNLPEASQVVSHVIESKS
ncbi:hypothetical protein Scep_016051 [Stephania cephalantha]|uniref:Uncharacterized protein n=1 Tax=Stephania cephalantha TaxID=152367 RepID=A0AAP0ILW1_9MAGN